MCGAINVRRAQEAEEDICLPWDAYSLNFDIRDNEGKRMEMEVGWT